jgi:two-component system chemotaxis family response regulator WspR
MPNPAPKISESAEIKPASALPDYHVMVLLVDDQAMVSEAISRSLASQPDIDFHYCADPREAVAVANQI